MEIEIAPDPSFNLEIPAAMRQLFPQEVCGPASPRLSSLKFPNDERAGAWRRECHP